DDKGLIGRGHLRHAEQRIIGTLTQEFGVDRDERMLRHAAAGVGKFGCRRDRLERSGGNGLRDHWRLLMSFRRGARASPHGARCTAYLPRIFSMKMNSQGLGSGPTG